MLDLEKFQEQLKDCENYTEVLALTKDLMAPVLQKMLDAEMTEHLGYTKHSRTEASSYIDNDIPKNARNGSGKKTLRTSHGTLKIAMPRDRASTFEPTVIKKGGSSLAPDMEERIISMYAKGLSVSDMKAYIHDIYGVDISETFISNVTNLVLEEVKEWQERPLASQYIVLFLDAIHYKVRSEGRIVTKACYTMMGITEDGMKEMVGIWIGEEEGAKFWLKLLNELKQRGVEDICIACIDGLSGFVEAINTAFPKAEVQRCIVHQVRATLKYIPHKDKKAVAGDLKRVYTAASEEQGKLILDEVRAKWKQYDASFTSWYTYWPELSYFFVYSAPIRKLMYTTNAIENVHRQFRKVTKNAVIFPSDTALLKRLYLAQRDMAKKWTMQTRDWAIILNELAIFFPGRIHI